MKEKLIDLILWLADVWPKPTDRNESKKTRLLASVLIGTVLIIVGFITSLSGKK